MQEVLIGTESYIRLRRSEICINNWKLTNGQMRKRFIYCQGITRYAVRTYIRRFQVIVCNQVIFSSAALQLGEGKGSYEMLMTGSSKTYRPLLSLNASVTPLVLHPVRTQEFS